MKNAVVHMAWTTLELSDQGGLYSFVYTVYAVLILL